MEKYVPPPRETKVSATGVVQELGAPRIRTFKAAAAQVVGIIGAGMLHTSDQIGKTIGAEQVLSMAAEALSSPLRAEAEEAAAAATGTGPAAAVTGVELHAPAAADPAPSVPAAAAGAAGAKDSPQAPRAGRRESKEQRDKPRAPKPKTGP